MAVTTKKDKDGKILKYKVTVVMADGRWATKVFAKNETRLAEQYEAELLTQRGSGSWQPRRSRTDSPLFGEYAVAAIDQRKIDESTKERYRNDVRAHLIPALGSARMHALTKHQCQEAVDTATNTITGDPLALATTSVPVPQVAQCAAAW